MAYSTELANRIRAALAAQPTALAVREVSMFGGLSFLVNDRLALAADTSGDLMLRCDPARLDELTARGAQLAEMRGRRMSTGWIIVSSDDLSTDRDLAFWLGVALEHNRAATGQSGPSRPHQASPSRQSQTSSPSRSSSADKGRT